MFLFLPQTASAAWHEASSDHFIIYSNDSSENIRNFAARLEQFDSALRLVTSAPKIPASASSRVTIYIVDDMGDIRRLAGIRSVAGFMENRASGSVAFVPRRADTGRYSLNAQTVLLHEYAHHFMYQSWGNTVVPLWFSEGFAEFYATATFEDDGKLVLGTAPRYRAWGMLDASILPARTMLKLNPGRLSDEQTAALYARGWLAIHYLAMEPERAKLLRTYLNAINSGTDADTASAVFGDSRAFDQALNRYIRQRKLPALGIKSGLDPGAVAVRPLTPGEAATMEVSIRSTRGVSEKTAPLVAAEARKAAAAYPDDAGAQNVLAEAEYDAGNHAAAEAAADRALRADPKSIHAMIYKGLSAQARLLAKADTKDTDWREVRRWYLAANRIDPEYAWPLILYYQSFGAAGQPVTANAESGLLYAHALAPFDYGLRILATRLLIGQQKLAEARVAIAPIAYSAEQGAAQRDWAMSVMRALDAMDGKAALAAMDSTPDDNKQVPAEGEKAYRGKRTHPDIS
ncbi:hypothetical protein [Sphingomonas sanxanigenens]|uniref:DUF1570 domain-containing protein n=1 Tax=Sphingomonas sanxanigenens DSM 19645 = NX02 TaxID=1123269 RepID=W0AAN1_9SPHN|nr:hypothetical protein [Sphingomonas sanxanigenens]AHE53527.1 hypothetical protein NX02_09025 [Sphingomonas sanxanigenens DSM 19645 = NX02]